VNLAARLFGFSGRVDRRTYLTTGVPLMALKYVVDAGAVWLFSRQLWTPFDYMLPLLTLKQSKIAAMSPWLAAALVLWTLPFLWIAVSMSLRRTLDAGKSPMLTLLVLVPVLNYAAMLWLASLPSAADYRAPVAVTTSAYRIRSAMLAILASLAVGIPAVALVTTEFRSYGLTLFLGSPFCLGAIAAYIHNRGHRRSLLETNTVIVLTLLILGLFLLLFALEGLVCLVMAFPLGVVAGLLGGAAGRALASSSGRPPAVAAHMFLLVPIATIVDRHAVSAEFEAVTSIVVAAPPERVWAHVVRFERIEEPVGMPFTLGIAYPVQATITGTGVGAVRRCEFSTGAFVEPITVWDAPRRLGFDVASQPTSLREWSPYRKVYAPHVDGFFISRRGEFRLIALSEGRTRLEGSTWYAMHMYPQAYWRPVAEWLLHRIHLRVLKQVRVEAERETGATTFSASRLQQPGTSMAKSARTQQQVQNYSEDY